MLVKSQVRSIGIKSGKGKVSDRDWWVDEYDTIGWIGYPKKCGSVYLVLISIIYKSSIQADLRFLFFVLKRVL